MSLNKLKICNGCSKPRKIYRSISGLKYCFVCANKIQPPKCITTTKHISKKSEKRIIQDKQYSKLRKQFLIDNPICQAKLENCTHEAIQIHHVAGRIGKLYLNVSKFLAICHNCHTWVTIHSKEAIELGLSKSRLNKE